MGAVAPSAEEPTGIHFNRQFALIDKASLSVTHNMGNWMWLIYVHALLVVSMLAVR